MTDEELRRLREQADAVPAGPWGFTYDGSSGWSVGDAVDPQSDPVCSVHDRNDDRAKAKVEFLAAARTAVPALLDEVQRLRAECLSYKAKLVDDRREMQKDARRTEHERCAKAIETAQGELTPGSTVGGVVRDLAARIRSLPDVD